MVEAYEHKYAFRNPSIVLKALEYHQDINFREIIEVVDRKYQ
jgi:hypothetical protein